MTWRCIYKLNYMCQRQPGLPGKSLVKMVAWWGDTSNQHCSIAEVSERCLCLIYLGSSVITALNFFFFGIMTYHLWAFTVQNYCFFSSFFVTSLFQRSNSLHECSMVPLHVFTWVNPNNQVGEMCESVTESVKKHLKTECCGHIMPVCWSVINGVMWGEGDERQRTSEGW